MKQNLAVKFSQHICLSQAIKNFILEKKKVLLWNCHQAFIEKLNWVYRCEDI